MFIETSRPRELGDRARLVSPLYNASAKFYCVSFFYHMYGKHIGESGDQESAPACWGWGQRGGPQEARNCHMGPGFPTVDESQILGGLWAESAQMGVQSQLVWGFEMLRLPESGGKWLQQDEAGSRGGGGNS